MFFSIPFSALRKIFWRPLPAPLTSAPMLLVIDNYDSFTYNLVQYLGEMGVDMQVHRNDQLSLAQIEQLKPERILISPGPCSPRESGLSNDVIKQFAGRVPTLGVCLGHQCIGHTFGAEVVVNYRMMHGKTSPIRHNGRELFEGRKGFSTVVGGQVLVGHAQLFEQAFVEVVGGGVVVDQQHAGELNHSKKEAR